ncbi:uncharacterized protein PAC_07878 [Phialocephala subalpina]|uniref:NACHT domain-containing protein n=1 Tax=Phialocephala subalpina TaxID=576137 RepID=A0A1L7WYY4_9HELO|nr:uncharacterized protein PAC_07878 [Phialocephala subalpina]
MDPLTALSLASSVAQLLDFGAKVYRETQEIARNGSSDSVKHLNLLSKDLETINTGILKRYKPLENRALTDEENGLVDVARQCRAISQEILDCTRSLISDEKLKKTNAKRPGYRHIADETGEASNEDEDKDEDLLAAKGRLDDEAKHAETNEFLNNGGPKSDEVLIKDPASEAVHDGDLGFKGAVIDILDSRIVARETAKNKQKFKSRWKVAKTSFKTVWNKHRLEDLGDRHVEYRAQLTLRLLVVLNAYQAQQSTTLSEVRSKSDEIIEALAIHSRNQAANLETVAAILTPRDGSPSTVVSNSGSKSSTKGRAIADDKWTRCEESTTFTNLGEEDPPNFSTQATRDCGRFILDALHFRGIHQRQESIPVAHKHTFDWVLRSTHGGDAWDSLLDWLERGSGCYWVSGKAGSGKSSLIKFLLGDTRLHEALQKWSRSEVHSHLVLGSFFFWYAGTTLQKSHEGLLRALLFAILGARPGLDISLFPDIYRQILTGRLHDTFELSEMELKLAFARLLKTIPADIRICLVIDGLDEYVGDLNELCDLLLGATKSQNIKILLSSRPIPICCQRFKRCPKLQLQDLTRLDIQRYVEGHLIVNSVLTEMEEIEAGVTSRLVNIIVTRASGVFLWVVLVVRILIKRLQDYDSIEEVLEEVNDLPPDLEQLYDRMLGSVNEKHRILSSKYLQLALKSLQISEAHPITPLQLFFAENEDYEGIIRNPLPALTEKKMRWACSSIEGRLRSRCCGLLEIQGPGERLIPEDESIPVTVGFFHRTVVEFLQLGTNWDRMTVVTSSTNFDAETALISSAVAEFQSMASAQARSTDDEGQYRLVWRASRMVVYEKNISDGLRVQFHNKYLPEFERVLLQTDSLIPLFSNMADREAAILLSTSRGFSRLILSFPQSFFFSCAIKASQWNVSILEKEILAPESPRLTIFYLLVHYVEETDARVRVQIFHSISSMKIEPSIPIPFALGGWVNDTPSNKRLSALFTSRWQSVQFPGANMCWTPWQFLLRYVRAITIFWSAPDVFNFQDPQMVLSLLDMILLMLRRGASLDNSVLGVQHNSFPDVAMHYTYSPRYLLYRLLKSIRFMASAPTSPCLAHIDDITSKAIEVDQFIGNDTEQNSFYSMDPEWNDKQPTGKGSIWQWAKLELGISENMLCEGKKYEAMFGRDSSSESCLNPRRLLLDRISGSEYKTISHQVEAEKDSSVMRYPFEIRTGVFGLRPPRARPEDIVCVLRGCNFHILEEKHPGIVKGELEQGLRLMN